jgi:ketosteroid isomerase-like protein
MSEQNMEVVRQLFDAAERFGDADAGGREALDAALNCLDPDLEWTPLRAATEGTYRGHQGFEQWLADTEESFESFETRSELRDLGGQVLAWGTLHVRGRGSGIDTEVPFGGIYDFRQGKILRWRDFGSKEQALKAAGRAE